LSFISVFTLLIFACDFYDSDDISGITLIRGPGLNDLYENYRFPYLYGNSRNYWEFFDYFILKSEVEINELIDLWIEGLENSGFSKGSLSSSFDKIFSEKDEEYFKVTQVGSGGFLRHEEEFRYTDDIEHAGILDVDDKLVAYGGHDVADRLGQHHAGHRLPMGHAYGICRLRLTGVYGQYAAADDFGHVRPRVYRYDEHRHGQLGHVEPQIH